MNRQDNKLIFGLLVSVFCMFAILFWISKQNPLVERHTLIQDGHAYQITVRFTQQGRIITYSVDRWPERELVQNGIMRGVTGEPPPPFETPTYPNFIQRMKLSLHMNK